MARRARPYLPHAVFAAAACLALGWMGLREFAFSDYEQEALPAFDALSRGDLSAFLARVPAYGGSFVLRAPFALAPELWGGGPLAVYRAVAVPCLLAAVALGFVLLARMRAAGQRPGARWLAFALCVANPVTLLALEIGHPEELLGAVLCVGAVLAAGRDRPLLAGLLLGLAVANKPWAVIAAGPVLVALPARRPRTLLAAAAATAAILAPLAAAGDYAGAVQGGVRTGQIFQPWQVWWPLGESGHVVVGSYGVKPGYRTAPEWLSPLAHPAIPLVAAALSLLWWWRRRGAAWPEPLLLLAFLLLVRCLLDPWNVSYYHLPFLLALLAWEVQARRAPPLLSTAATLATWASFAVGPRLLEPDAQSLAYLAWAIPLAGALGLRTFSPGAWGRLAAPAAAVLRARLPTLARAALPQPTFRSSLG